MSKALSNFRDLCAKYDIPCATIEDCRSYDDTTLFCPAGMQRYKKEFKEEGYFLQTRASVQPCLRLNDLDLIGDGTHSLLFTMLGTFSFGQWSMQQACDFWHEYVALCGLELSHVTVHPDVAKQWVKYHPDDMIVVTDEECTWSDGEVGGYCTEFYVEDKRTGDHIEIGNVVNPNGTGVDAGFGLERIQFLMDSRPKSTLNAQGELKVAIEHLLKMGIKPANKLQGYILRKLIRKAVRLGSVWVNHEEYDKEVLAIKKTSEKFKRLWDKHKDQPMEWWWDTHGIDLAYEKAALETK